MSDGFPAVAVEHVMEDALLLLSEFTVSDFKSPVCVLNVVVNNARDVLEVGHVRGQVIAPWRAGQSEAIRSSVE